MIQTIDMTLRGGAIVLILFMVMVAPRNSTARTQAWMASALGCGIAAYLVCSSPIMHTMPVAIKIILGVGCLANPWLLWLLSRAIFSDGCRLGWRHGLALLAILALGTPAYLWEVGIVDAAPAQAFVAVSQTAFKFVAVILAILALLEAWRGRASDLVERRRMLRTYVVSIGASYMLLVLMTELWLRGSTPPPGISLLNSAGILLLAVAVAKKFLTPRFDLLLDPLVPTLRRSTPDAKRDALLARLEAALQTNVHHEDGLTIARLAEKLQSQEYLLRSLINENLGFRNFNDFLHRHRVADARKALADPVQAHLPVLTIALNLGYGSIGPFNRAFRELTGETPTAYRRRALADQARGEQPETS